MAVTTLLNSCEFNKKNSVFVVCSGERFRFTSTWKRLQKTVLYIASTVQNKNLCILYVSLYNMQMI